MRNDTSVAILMATYNGAVHLVEQLDSIAAQSLRPTQLVISDDGSSDATRELVSAWAKAHPDIGTGMIDGPRSGAAENFLTLLRRPVSTDFTAISDQDDVWLPNKLAVAVARLRPVPSDIPTLYCGRTLEVRDDLSAPRLSRGAPRPPGFAHALVQSLAGGNTMVLNRVGAEAIRAAALATRKIVMHDWWIYQVISGIGGRVIFDPAPQVLYRQHEGNVIGANRGAVATLMRLRLVATGRFADWCACNIAALRQIEDRLTPENRALLNAFDTARRLPPLQSAWAIRRAGLYRQGLRAQTSLYLAALLRKL